MANVTIFTPARIIGFHLSDDDAQLIDRSFLDGDDITLRLDAGNCSARVTGDMGLIDLPGGWEWWQHTPRAQYPERARAAVRSYPDQWTGLVDIENAGWRWFLNDGDDCGMATSTATTLAEAIAECDSEWEAHRDNAS